MPSELKSETSRINGAKSHGPKTPEGKEISSKNSLKHGHTARSTILLQCESPDEFKEFLAEHITIHQPATPPELELVDQMAIARWRIRRFVAAETDLIDSEMVRNREKVDKEFAPTHSGVHVAMAIRSLADESRCLSLMSRYESRLQRCHDKAYAALRQLQQLRASQPSAPMPPAPDPEPSTASSPEPPPEPVPAPTIDNPSVSAGTSPSTHNPSVSAGSPSVENQKSPIEPTDPRESSPGIHLCPPLPPIDGGNSEDH
jgi:hypothetical protein